MKIGILTFHTPINYGAVLQAYALQKFLKLQYSQYTICNIDFKTEEHIKRYNIFAPLRRNVIKYIYEQLCILFRYSALKRRKSKFNLFVSEELNLTKRFETTEKLLGNMPEMDVYLVGSDQVFHPSSPYLRAYYFDFVKGNARKIAYAPSFGMSDFTEQIKNRIAPHLKDFDVLSCREKDGADFICNIIGKEVPTVLDPVFLLNKEQWSEIAVEPTIKEKYIFVYDLNGKENLITIAKKIKEKTGFKIICQTQSASKFYNIDQQRFDSGPREFVGLIKNSEYVVTDSFHGTAFSILFNKPQFIYNAKPKASSRIFSLMKMIGLEDRIVEYGMSKTFVYNSNDFCFDYSNKLDELIAESKLFLKNSVEV